MWGSPAAFQEDEVEEGRGARGGGETLVLGSSRSMDCGGLIHNTSCPTPPSLQMALWWWKSFSPFFFWFPQGSRRAVPPHCFLSRGGSESALPPSSLSDLCCICGCCGEKTKQNMQMKNLKSPLHVKELHWHYRHERFWDFMPRLSYTWQTLDHPQPPASAPERLLYS